MKLVIQKYVEPKYFEASMYLKKELIKNPRRSDEYVEIRLVSNTISINKNFHLSYI